MQRVLSDGLWPEVAELAKRSKRKRAAIAYVTTDRFVKFAKGDTLIVDASDGKIAGAATSAKVLLAAHQRGARLFHCEGLHSKVLLLDNVAVVGSANLSNSSATDLTEAAIVTDHAPTLSSLAAFITELAKQTTPMTLAHLKRLSQIKVVRRPPTGKNPRKPVIRISEPVTWLVGIHEIDVNRYGDEAEKIDTEQAEAEELKSSTRSSVEWIRWTGKSGFRSNAKPGDTVIRIWRPQGRKFPTTVYRRASILSREEDEKCTRFYTEEPANSEKTSISWSSFQTLLRKAGYVGKISPGAGRLLEESLAERVFALWRESRSPQG
jgi:hypothetical protein